MPLPRRVLVSLTGVLLVAGTVAVALSVTRAIDRKPRRSPAVQQTNGQPKVAAPADARPQARPTNLPSTPSADRNLVLLAILALSLAVLSTGTALYLYRG